LEDKYRGKGTQLIPNKDAASRGLFEQAASIETSYFDPHASALVFEQVFKE
jgi:glutathione S-transferase